MNSRRIAMEVARVHPLSRRGEYLEAVFALLLRRAARRPEVAFNRLIKNEIIVEYEGIKFVLNSYSGLGPLFIRFYEPLAFASISAAGGDVFLDVGANVGAYTLRMASRFKRVWAVEPGPVAAKILRENVALNRLGNVTVIEKAVSRRSGKARLCRSGEISTWKLASEESEYLEVATVSLADLIGPTAKIDMLKIDAEGSEVDILEGSGDCLNVVSKIVVESQIQNCSNVRSLLESRGFEVKDLDAEGGITLLSAERLR